jgi:hypothetical protein
MEGEHGLRVFENRALRGMGVFGYKQDEVTGGLLQIATLFLGGSSPLCV